MREHGPWLGDAVRVGAATSVVVATVAHGALGFALFFLVLGGTMVPRALGAAWLLDLVYCSSLLLGAWAAQLDWYLRVGWLDVVVHAAVTGLVAAMARLALERAGAVPGGAAPGRPRLATAVGTATLGVTGAVLWELGEWFGHARVDDRIQVGYTDTMTDLAAGLVGAVGVASVVALTTRRAWTRP